MSIRRK